MWTPDSPTTSGSKSPEHWYRADTGTWQDSVGNTAADDDGEVVGAWEDKTANEDDVTQGTADNKPTLQTNELNSEPVLRFDGANDYLQGAFTTGGALSQAFTVFAVAKLNATAVNDGSHRCIVNGDDGTNEMLMGQNATPDPDGWFIYAAAILNGGSSDSNWNIWTAVFNGNSSQFWHNGVSEASGAAGAQAADGLTVGATYNGTTPWYGDVAEILIYSELNDADKNEVGNYLSDRYNISYTEIS